MAAGYCGSWGKAGGEPAPLRIEFDQTGLTTTEVRAAGVVILCSVWQFCSRPSDWVLP